MAIEPNVAGVSREVVAPALGRTVRRSLRGRWGRRPDAVRCEQVPARPASCVRSVLVVLDGRGASWEALDRGVATCREHHALLTVAVVSPILVTSAVTVAMHVDLSAHVANIVDDIERAVRRRVPADVGLTLRRHDGTAAQALRCAFGACAHDLIIAPARSSAWRALPGIARAA
jgi:hypothetical protein